MPRDVSDIQSEIRYHKDILRQIRNKELSPEYCNEQNENRVLDKLEELQSELGNALDE